jgi:hypothetical protein
MPGRVTAAEVDGVIRRLRRGVRVPAAAGVRAAARVAVQAGAARGVRRARARVSVREVARVIVRVRAGVETEAVIRPGKVTAAAQGASTRRVRAAEAIRPYLNPAKAVRVLRASRLIRLPRGRERKRPANLISQNTRIRKIHRRTGMILIGVWHRR